MVRKSVLVYDLLKSENFDKGFTETEIMNRLQAKYGITPGKGTRRQINVALRRGIDYGILVKSTRKYRFDPDSLKTASEKQVRKTKRRKVPAKRTTKNKRRSNTRSEQHPQVPNPTVPKLPNWDPKRRNLREEPLSKVIKHQNFPST